MSLAELTLHEPKMAEDIKLLAEMYDRRGQPNQPLPVYKSVYERCDRYACLKVGEHEIVCGQPKRKKPRKVQESFL